MALRTGKASQRMVLQELVGASLKKSNNIPSFISHLEKKGVNVLFNQASTGRVSGISYCYGGIVAKGQALGNQFKWGQVSKILHYEQTKDFQPIERQTFEQEQHIRREEMTLKLENQQLIEYLMELCNNQQQIMKNQKILQHQISSNHQTLTGKQDPRIEKLISGMIENRKSYRQVIKVVQIAFFTLLVP